MDIKRVDDRPMLIHLDFVSMVFLVKRRLTQAWPSLSSLLSHTKEKPKIHAKGAPEAKIKGGNVLAVRHGPKVAGAVPEEGAADGKIKLKKASVHVVDKRKTGQERTAADGVDVRNGSNLYFASNKSIHAAFCRSEAQLREFLAGTFNALEWSFDEGLCSKGCLDVLRKKDVLGETSKNAVKSRRSAI